MSQQETKPYVLVSNIREDTKSIDLQMIAPKIAELVDEWQHSGRIMWSGPFDDEQSSMAVFETTEQEANEFFKKYENICSGVLNFHMYQWDAMPILSVLSR